MLTNIGTVSAAPLSSTETRFFHGDVMGSLVGISDRYRYPLFTVAMISAYEICVVSPALGTVEVFRPNGDIVRRYQLSRYRQDVLKADALFIDAVFNRGQAFTVMEAVDLPNANVRARYLQYMQSIANVCVGR